MKKNRFLAAFSAAVLLLLSLASCAAERPALMKCGSFTVTAGMYNYYYSCYKYLYRVDNKGFADTESGWTSSFSDTTYEADFNEFLADRLKTRLIAAYLYESSGKNESASKINAVLKSVIETTFYYTDADSKEEYTERLMPYGADYEDMLRCLLFEYEYDLLFEGLFGQSGLGVLSDPAFSEDVKRFYDETYIRIRYMTVSTSDTKQPEKAEAYQNATSDEGFDAMLESYAKNESTDAFFYIYGSYSVEKALLDAVAALEVGENASVTLSDGSVCYLRRYATNREYEEEKYEDYFEDFALPAARYAYRSYLYSFMDKLEVYTLPAYRPWERETCIEENTIDIYQR